MLPTYVHRLTFHLISFLIFAQIDALGLQLKLKTDELRTLYYNNRHVDRTESQKQKENMTVGMKIPSRPRRRRGKLASRQCPCHVDHSVSKPMSGGAAAHVVDTGQSVEGQQASGRACLPRLQPTEEPSRLPAQNDSNPSIKVSTAVPGEAGSIGKDTPIPEAASKQFLQPGDEPLVDSASVSGSRNQPNVPVGGKAPSGSRSAVCDQNRTEGDPSDQPLADENGGDGPANDSLLPVRQCPECRAEILGEENAFGKDNFA